MSKYNLDGSSNELRLEICRLQPTLQQMQECNQELKGVISSENMVGFWFAIFMVVVFMIGFGCGKYS